MSTRTKTSTDTSAATAAVRATDLEAAAADAAAAATQARELAENRRRTELAERGRAEAEWTQAQVEARRPHQAVDRLNEAWDTLIKALGAPGVDQADAWWKFCTIHGECAATIRAFEGAPGVTPVLAGRWDPDPSRSHEMVTFADALTLAMNRAATSVRGLAWERTEQEIETERETAIERAVAALPADSRPTPVAWFVHPRRAGASGHGWDSLIGVDTSGEDYEAHECGTLAVYSAEAARHIRGVVSVNVPLDTRFPHEITEDEATRLVEVFEHGADGTLTREGALLGQSADEVAEVGEYTKAVRAAARPDRRSRLSVAADSR